MEQLFYIEPGRVEWREVPPPGIVDDEDALVRPIAIATCDLDTALVYGRAPFPGPFPFGHEGVGEVVEVGRGVNTVAVGQRVIIPFQISCGRCGRCTRGLTASCESVNRGAMYGLEHGKPGSEVTSVFKGFFWVTTQLLTVSSQMKNPVTTGGLILDIVLELWAISVVTAAVGSVAAFFQEK